MKIVYFGTADFACPALKKLASDPSFEVVGVVTQPDRPKGRGGKLTPPPVKLAALDFHCKVFQPESMKSEGFISQLKYMKPDFHVVAAYGRILTREILDLPRMGSFNIHASLLPRYRGAAPIHRAIMDGCEETGVTIMKMDEGLDTGEMVLQQSTHIRDTDDIESLHNRLAELGAELVVEALWKVANGTAKMIEQDDLQSSYAKKLTRADERIDWKESKRQIWNRIRTFYPGPGAYTYLDSGKGLRQVKFLAADFERIQKGVPGEVIKIDRAGIHISCLKGSICVRELQMEGKKKMTAAEFLRGYPLTVGEKFLSE